jgi:ribonuclease D
MIANEGARTTKNARAPHAQMTKGSGVSVPRSMSSDLISTASQLDQLLPLIAGNDRVAADTEADSLHCYREKLCLLQISLPEGDFLIDPLAGNDLRALATLLATKEIVLHGADYDLRLLRRGLDFRP